MAAEYSPEAAGKLAEMFRQAEVHRPMRVGRYDAGAELVYDVTGVVPSRPARVKLVVDRFVGGGFAGQVYRVKVAEIESPEGPIDGLEVGGAYAAKILIPPSGRSRLFRDLMYMLGFQAPFSLQVNPAAARAAALWQKFIRQAAAIRFGDDQTVVDVLGTFVDSALGSCGEISQWIDGRTWRFEVDDHLLSRHRKQAAGPDEQTGSPEYCAKKAFMAEFVRLLHDVGAPELARQYEWWTCKSQPNVLKRFDAPDEPAAGLTAVDFRAGLALLALVPMSPGDLKLIFKGLARGSLVQFDRGDLDVLWGFISSNSGMFEDMRDAYEQLAKAEDEYRNSQIDVTHNHVRLLYDGRLWSGIFDSAVGSWRVRNITDEATDSRLKSSRPLTLAFAVLCLVPMLGVVAGLATLIAGLAAGAAIWPILVTAAVLIFAVPLAGKGVRKIIGRADYRRHLMALLTSFGYLRRAAKAHMAESLIRWHRAGRVSDVQALRIAAQPWRYPGHWLLSVAPVFAHRLLTDRRYAASLARYIFVRPVRLYFSPAAREQWLTDMVTEGQQRHMLTDEDAQAILSRAKEPFIQKYLKSLAVHVCTLPVTQIVSVAVAIWYVRTHPELTGEQAGLAVGTILVAFQITPISPGSLVRGLYVLYLVLREKNFKDYNIAVFLGFFKYVGYLAFPIQMTHRYPALARFMAAHWATGAVRIIPVFGERGALLEHGVFDLFYNYPLTVRRRMRKRAECRQPLTPRAWHGAAVAALGLVVLAAIDVICQAQWGVLPTLKNIWPAAILIPAIIGAAATVGAGGKAFGRRINLAILCGLSVGVGYALLHAALSFLPGLVGAGFDGQMLWEVSKNGMWSVFVFTLLAAISALVTEINLPEATAAGSSDDLEEPATQQELADDVGVDAGDDVVEQDAPTGR